jgi:ketosteroid isomerase-like protein
MKTLKMALFALMATFGMNAAAQTQSENKKIVNAGFERWANGKGSFFDLLTDDVVWTINGSAPLSKTYRGKKQFLDEVINPLNERLSQKIVPSVRALYAEKDMVIALIDGKATATDGRPYNMSYAWFMQMKNGKIIKVDAFLDAIQFADVMQRVSGK